MDINNMEWAPLFLSLKLAVITTILLLVIIVPVVFILVFKKIPGKSFIEALLSLPMVLPPTVLGFYLLIAMGPEGGLGSVWQSIFNSRLLFSFSGIVLASIIYNIPYAVSPLKASFKKIDKKFIDNARVLGLSQPTIFFKIILPNAVPGISASAILVFLHTIGEFGVILMVGGSIPGKTKVTSVAIYEAVEAMRYSDAAWMSLALIPLCYFFLLLVNYINRETEYDT